MEGYDAMRWPPQQEETTQRTDRGRLFAQKNHLQFPQRHIASEPLHRVSFSIFLFYLSFPLPSLPLWREIRTSTLGLVGDLRKGSFLFHRLSSGKQFFFITGTPSPSSRIPPMRFSLASDKLSVQGQSVEESGFCPRGKGQGEHHLYLIL